MTMQRNFNPLRIVYDVRVVGADLLILRHGVTYATLTLNEKYRVKTVVSGKGDRWLARTIPQTANELQAFANVVMSHITEREKIVAMFWQTKVQAKNPAKG